MSKKVFCALCSCKDHKDMGKGIDKNFKCPLVGKICSVCCHHEFDGGMGAQDTAQEVYKISGRRPVEAFAICRTCPYGGKIMDKAVMALGKEIRQKVYKEK